MPDSLVGANVVKVLKVRYLGERGEEPSGKISWILIDRPPYVIVRDKGLHRKREFPYIAGGRHLSLIVKGGKITESNFMQVTW